MGPGFDWTGLDIGSRDLDTGLEEGLLDTEGLDTGLEVGVPLRFFVPKP